MNDQWNFTPCIFEGGGRYFFAAVYCSLNAAFTLVLYELHFLLACLPELARAAIIFISVFKKMLFCKQGDMLNWTFLQGKKLFKKLWLSLYKRAELDMRSTKVYNFKAQVDSNGFTKIVFLSLSLSFSHTHARTHTHTQTVEIPLSKP